MISSLQRDKADFTPAQGAGTAIAALEPPFYITRAAGCNKLRFHFVGAGSAVKIGFGRSNPEALANIEDFTTAVASNGDVIPTIVGWPDTAYVVCVSPGADPATGSIQQGT